MSVAVPKMTYGAEIWYNPPRKTPGAKHKTGSVRVLHQLTKVQRMATIVINGALRTTPTDILDIHAGIMPLECTMLKVCHRALVRLCTLPELHPLHQVIHEYCSVHARKHYMPLHKLMDLFPEIHLDKLETITPDLQRAPYVSLPFDTEIAKDQEDSMLNEVTSKPEIKVFTDRSGMEGKIGAVAVMYRKGRPMPAKVLRYHLGSSKKYTSFKAEVVGAILGVWLIRMEHVAGHLPIAVLTDSQAVIKRIRTCKMTTTQYLIENFLTLTDGINAANVNPNLKKFKLAWISGHSRVQGNEKVDEEAKRAAQGDSSPQHILPPLLQGELPTSMAAVKQDFHRELMDRWKVMWMASPRQPKLSWLDPCFTYRHYAKLQSELRRQQVSILTQICTGHIPLNFYLHCIKKSEMSNCTACQRRRLPAKETLTHFLFECEAYNRERHELDR